jgi:hypothetical protein
VVLAVHTDALSLSPHQSLAALLGVTNTLFCSSALSLHAMAALLGAPERAAVGVWQGDVVVRLLVGDDAHQAQLARQLFDDHADQDGHRSD